MGHWPELKTGENKVQGTDYAYTIHGWLKGVNSTSLQTRRDIGKDGDQGSANNSLVAADVMGFSLGYFEDDYQSVTDGVKSTLWGSNDYNFVASIQNNSILNTNNLYNGNIGHMTTAISL